MRIKGCARKAHIINKNIMKKKVVNKKSAKKKGGGLLAGALVGGALGVVAGMLESESGQKMQKNFMKLSGDFLNYIAPQIKKMKEVGEPEYEAFVAEKAKSYAKAKKLSLAEAKILAAKAKHSWKHIKKHLPKR